MALSLVEANKYSSTVLSKAVWDILIKDDPILPRVKFDDLVGNSLTYDRYTTAATAAWRDVGDTITEDTPVITQNTAQLRILIGDADVDAFLARTRSNIIDMEQEVIEQKTEAIKRTFLDSFIYGDNSANTKEPDGCQVLIASTTYNTVHAGSGTGTALSIDKLRQAIDLIKGPKELMIVSSKAMRRRVSTYLDSVGSAFPADRDQFGRMIRFFEDIPWEVSDYILDTETAASGAYAAKTGGANTSIFILNFANGGIRGLQAGPLTVEKKMSLETKDANRFRLKWYASQYLPNLVSCAKVDGIVAASAVVA